MVPRRNFSLLSNRLAQAGGRRIPESVLERDYCIAWFLAGLSTSPLSEHMAFKGGTALKRCYFGDYRFSDDLDFTLLQEAPFELILTDLNPLFDNVRRQSGVIFRYSREDRAAHANSYTFYLAYEGPLPGSGKAIKVDVTIKELLVAAPVSRPVLQAYPEYADLPRGAQVLAYPLEEIAREKIIALTDPARNEPRDLYDLWFLTEGRHVDLRDLRDGLDRKLAFRGRQASGLGEALAHKEPRLRKDWERRLSGQMVALPEFDAVFRSVRRSIRHADRKSRARRLRSEPT